MTRLEGVASAVDTDRPVSPPGPEESRVAFEQRWIAWQARGAKRDQLAGRRLMFLLVTGGIVAVAAWAIWL